MREPVYDATRDAWRDIWRQTDIEAELQTRTYRRSRLIRSRFLPYLPRDRPILEAGCGLGVELVSLAEAGCHAVGVDYVVSALERLKACQPQLRIAAGDVHALPFADGALGGYLSFGVLEHFAFGPEPALREAARVLGPDGILVVTVPAPNLVWRLNRVKKRWLGSAAASTPAYYETTYAAPALARFVTAAGFEVIACESIGHDFTLWGCGRLFRRDGYYRTSGLAEGLGRVLARVLPRSMAFATLVIARRQPGS